MNSENSKQYSSVLEKDYAALYEIAESFCAELSRQIQSLLDLQSIALGFPIQSRVKTLESLREKFERTVLRVETLKDVQDLIGLRLILLFKRDVSSVCSLLDDNFEVLRKYNTEERLKDDQFGYSSIHFVVELSDEWLAVPTLGSMRGLRAEIQVRTVAQHIWAAASQVLQYKQKQAVPASVKRAIYRASALLETVDLEFERVLEHRDNYRTSLDISSTDGALNVDLLEKTLDVLLPPQNKLKSEKYSHLLADLTHFNIRTQENVVELWSKHRDEVLEEESRIAESAYENLRDEPMLTEITRQRVRAFVYFSHVGLMREVLSSEFLEEWQHYFSGLESSGD